MRGIDFMSSGSTSSPLTTVLIVILIIEGLVILILAAICATKESEITGFYKSIGLFGRGKAYFCLDFVVFAPIAAVICLVTLIYEMIKKAGTAYYLYLLALLAFFVIFSLIGFAMLNSIRKKCPAGLKDRVVKDLFTAGLGISMKIAFFFIASVWALMGPQAVTGSNGMSYYIYQGEVYTPGGEHVGTMDGEKMMILKQYT